MSLKRIHSFYRRTTTIRRNENDHHDHRTNERSPERDPSGWQGVGSSSFSNSFIRKARIHGNDNENYHDTAATSTCSKRRQSRHASPSRSPSPLMNRTIAAQTPLEQFFGLNPIRGEGGGHSAVPPTSMNANSSSVRQPSLPHLPPTTAPNPAYRLPLLTTKPLTTQDLYKFSQPKSFESDAVVSRTNTSKYDKNDAVSTAI